MLLKPKLKDYKRITRITNNTQTNKRRENTDSASEESSSKLSFFKAVTYSPLVGLGYQSSFHTDYHRLHTIGSSETRYMKDF